MRYHALSVGRLLNKRALFSAIAALGVAGGASSVRAALSLTISEPGFSPVTETDAATPGQVSFFGSYGNFSTDIEVGLTDIFTPTASSAYLQLTSLDVTNTGTGPADTLTVTLSENSPFTFPGTPASTMTLSSGLGGTLTPATAGDTVSFQSLVTPQGGGPISPSAPPFTATSSPGSENVEIPTVSANFTRSAGFTMENITTLSIAPGEALNVSGTSSVTAVPEPMSAGLLAGAALIGLSRRRRVR